MQGDPCAAGHQAAQRRRAFGRGRRHGGAPHRVAQAAAGEADPHAGAFERGKERAHSGGAEHEVARP